MPSLVGFASFTFSLPFLFFGGLFTSPRSLNNTIHFFESISDTADSRTTGRLTKSKFLLAIQATASLSSVD